MNVLTIEKRTQIINLLVEGNSMRATSRLADCSINTVTKLLIDVGTALKFDFLTIRQKQTLHLLSVFLLQMPHL